MLKMQQYGILGLSLLPVIFYSKIPLLRDNPTIGIRILLSTLLIFVPSKIYSSYADKKSRKLDEQVCASYRGKLLKYERSGDDKYLY